MIRHVVLFAREPGREAREKGFGAPAEDLFATFAAGWLEAAGRAGARLVLATPPEDRATWRRRLPAGAEVLWMTQRGGSFGERLEGIARRAAELPGRAVLVGGDVAPAPGALGEAFEAFERGAQAVLGPAADGGVSLVALGAQDCDLLAALAPRQRGVAAALESRLRARGRQLALVTPSPDVDGPRSLRLLLRRAGLSPLLAALAHQALPRHRFPAEEPSEWSLLSRWVAVLRGPPLPA